MKTPSLAIALAAKKRMSKGGKVTEASKTGPEFMDKDEQDESLKAGKPLSDLYNPKPAMAQGGPVRATSEADEHYSSIADAILAKKRMAAGGEVAHGTLDTEESGQSPYDDLNGEAFEKELYDDNQLSAQPMDGDEHGDADERPKGDLVSRIRERMKSRRGF